MNDEQIKELILKGEETASLCEKLGKRYYEKQEYQKALEYYLEGLKDKNLKSVLTYYIALEEGIADCYFNMEQYQQAVEYMNIALASVMLTGINKEQHEAMKIKLNQMKAKLIEVKKKTNQNSSLKRNRKVDF